MPVAKRVILLLVLCLVPLLAPAQAPKPLASDREKTGYMIGIDVGQFMGGVVVVQKAPKDIKRMLSIAGIESKD